MKNPDTFNIEQEVRLPDREGEKNDLLVIILLLKENWYIFVIALVLAVGGARFYIRHTLPVFQTSASVLINETEDRPQSENFALMQGLGLSGGMRNLENQIMILKSRALVESVLIELPFELEYYVKTIRNRLPFYPEAPVTLVYYGGNPLPKDVEFSINYLGNNNFTFKSESKDFPLEKSASFGDTIHINSGKINISCNDEEWFNADIKRKLYLINHSHNFLINYYANRLDIQQVSRDGSILNVNLIGTNPKKDVDYLNKHLEKYKNISLERKNLEAERRIQFIDDQLIGISDSLSITENRLQQFRSSNRVMDLSAQGQAIIGQITLYENERARLSLEADYYDYLTGYLSKDASGEMPIVPITMGINDPGLTRLVEELAALQAQLSATGAGQMNPLQKNLAQRVSSAKDALKETLNGLRRANSLARSENQQQINRANTQASSLPVTERKLLGMERKFKINDELYTFLLETRAEQQMQKASNRPDSEVVDPADARFSGWISPNPKKIYSITILGFFALAFAIVFLKSAFNKKLTEEDIRKMTDLPVIGNILHSDDKTNTIVFSNPDSINAEAFRSLRSKMQFFTKDTRSPVILVTSSAPSEGKTHVAINLASAYSLLGKKTVIVGFDLRRPKIFQDFNISNQTGISTWLIGQTDLKEIIHETTYENLSIIPAGPIPPNPSELIALEKTELLLTCLKEKFEFIIIDSPPIMVVSDIFRLASLSDACLFIIRLRFTLRDVFEIALNEIKTSSMKSTSLVINDLQRGSKRYGYGYSGEKKRWKKHQFRRKQDGVL